MRAYIQIGFDEGEKDFAVTVTAADGRQNVMTPVTAAINIPLTGAAPVTLDFLVKGLRTAARRPGDADVANAPLSAATADADLIPAP